MRVETRAWHWVEWALFGMFTSWLGMELLFIATRPDYLHGINRYFLLGGLLFSYFVPLCFFRPGYINYTLFPIAVLLTGGLFEWTVTAKIGAFAGTIILPLLMVGFLTYGNIALWSNIAVFAVGFPILEYDTLVGRNHSFSELINIIVNSLLVFGTGFCLNKLMESNLKAKRLHEENLLQYELIREQNRALEQYANQVEKLTLVEERNRLAQELHDTVGHTFTSVIMGMDAVSYLIEAAPGKAKEKLDVLRTVTRSGLEEVRRSIHQIAPPDDDGTLTQQLSRVADEFAVHTGTKVHVNTKGRECNLPKQTRLTLIRCLQESLTNAKRHGQAKCIDITLEYQQQQAVLRVEDDGRGAEILEAGFGIRSMQERLAALQGSVSIDSKPGIGTVVTCKIPIAREDQQVEAVR